MHKFSFVSLFCVDRVVFGQGMATDAQRSYALAGAGLYDWGRLFLLAASFDLFSFRPLTVVFNPLALTVQMNRDTQYRVNGAVMQYALFSSTCSEKQCHKSINTGA
jgi:hypothetical protein